jgi:hypothetical protein
MIKAAAGLSLMTLAGCGGGATGTSTAQFNASVASFAPTITSNTTYGATSSGNNASIIDGTPTATMPTGTVNFSGQLAFDFVSPSFDVKDVRGITSPDVIGDLTLTAELGTGPESLSGAATNFIAKDGTSRSGTINLSAGIERVSEGILFVGVNGATGTISNGAGSNLVLQGDIAGRFNGTEGDAVGFIRGSGAVGERFTGAFFASQ